MINFVSGIPAMLISVLEVGVCTENHCGMYKHGSFELIQHYLLKLDLHENESMLYNCIN